MEKKLNLLAQNIHSLSNRFVVIERAFEMFSKQQPDNKLNGIAGESIQEAMRLMNENKDILESLMNPSSEDTNIDKSEAIKSWYQSLHNRNSDLEEMFPITINITDKEFEINESSLESNSVYDEILMNTLEYISTLGGTEVFIDLAATGNKVFLAITDNAQEVVQKDSAEIQSIENFCQKINAQFNFKSIQGIGNNLKINF